MLSNENRTLTGHLTRLSGKPKRWHRRRRTHLCLPSLWLPPEATTMVRLASIKASRTSPKMSDKPSAMCLAPRSPSRTNPAPRPKT